MNWRNCWSCTGVELEKICLFLLNLFFSDFQLELNWSWTGVGLSKSQFLQSISSFVQLISRFLQSKSPVNLQISPVDLQIEINRMEGLPEYVSRFLQYVSRFLQYVSRLKLAIWRACPNINDERVLGVRWRANFSTQILYKFMQQILHDLMICFVFKVPFFDFVLSLLCLCSFER